MTQPINVHHHLMHPCSHRAEGGVYIHDRRHNKRHNKRHKMRLVRYNRQADQFEMHCKCRCVRVCGVTCRAHSPVGSITARCATASSSTSLATQSMALASSVSCISSSSSLCCFCCCCCCSPLADCVMPRCACHAALSSNSSCSTRGA